MINSESERSNENVSDLNYLTGMMRGNKQLIKEIIDAFLKLIPEELHCINDAVTKKDYPIIKKLAHKMRSSVSIMGISVIAPVLQEMEDLGAMAANIEKIKELNQKINLICKQAIEEIKREKHNYV